MNTTTSLNRPGRVRNLHFFANPKLWPAYPFLPVVKRPVDKPEEYGVLFDAMGIANLAGHSATVFMTNLFMMPEQLSEFLALPKEVFDTWEELADAGWCVD
jgi:hypothetical protein